MADNDADCENRCYCGMDDAVERKFLWHVRPREKDRIRHGRTAYFDDFFIYLCDECYNKAKDHIACGRGYVIGWDWWDAVDGLLYGTFG